MIASSSPAKGRLVLWQVKAGELLLVPFAIQVSHPPLYHALYKS